MTGRYPVGRLSEGADDPREQTMSVTHEDQAAAARASRAPGQQSTGQQSTGQPGGSEESVPRVRFDTEPGSYRHWRLYVDGAVATLTLACRPRTAASPGYELKMNSYDLGVDIELYDAVQRLRFEHPAGPGRDPDQRAGPDVLRRGQHRHAGAVRARLQGQLLQVLQRDAGRDRGRQRRCGQIYIAALNGTAAGGGYELALACDQILLVDDGSSTVALPEVPLLGVLPGTGGLTRLIDKRGVRRDLADVFATTAEGVRGERAVDWRLVDEIARPTDFGPRSGGSRSGRSPGARRRPGRPAGRTGGAGVELRRAGLFRSRRQPARYDHVRVEPRPARGHGHDHHRRAGRGAGRPGRAARAGRRGLAAGRRPRARRRDQRLRFSEPELGTWLLKTDR